MNGKNVLIIAAHPDDELLGCAGTVHKLIKNGSKATSLILGEGMKSRGNIEESMLKGLRADTVMANKEIGITKVHFEQLPDNQFDSLPLLEVVKVVEKYVDEIKPDIIFTHFGGDLNIDHRMTFEAVLTACRPQPGFHHPEIYCFEVPSATDYHEIGQCNAFVPNVHVDIEDEINVKIKALAHYQTEMRPFPHSRSLEGIKILAQARGVRVGCAYVEAFVLVRKIIRNRD